MLCNGYGDNLICYWASRCDTRQSVRVGSFASERTVFVSRRPFADVCGERPAAPVKGLRLGRGDTLQLPGKPAIQSIDHIATPGNRIWADHADGWYHRRIWRRVKE